MLNLFSFQVVFSYSLYKFLTQIAEKETQFYIARDRKASENAFVQCGNHINGNTNMIIHGLISKRYGKSIWSLGSFSYIRRVYVWGKHDKEVIFEVQNLLKEKVPEVKIGVFKPFFHKSFYNKDDYNQKKDKILFALQPFSNFLIKYLRKLKVKSYVLIVRLHPASKSLLKRIKMNNRKDLIFDQLEKPIDHWFPQTKLFITFSSTSALEAISYGIPVLFVDFPEKHRKFSIYHENTLTREEEEIIFCKSYNELKEKIELCIRNKTFCYRVYNINTKLFNYFVSD